MDNFEHLKQVWQQQAISAGVVNISELKKSNSDNQRRLERIQLISAAMLLGTAVFIVWIGFLSQIEFHSTLTYVAVVFLALICVIQSIINLSIFTRLHRIDVAEPVAQHLDQWERYYAFRKQLIRINLPIYYFLLNGAFGLYFVEILGHLPLAGRLIALSIYTAWMLYAYFILGKRSLRKENKRLETIIGNLRMMQNQLTDKL